ncbi:MAG: family 1 glycosylhydrolase, partial [Candidatus Methanomethyliaceae archaeon]
LTPRSIEENRLIFECHKKAREIIKSINPNIKIGITLSLWDYKILPGGEKFVEKLQREDFIEWLPYLKDDDFIGVQNYSQKTYGEEGVIAEPNMRTTLMGYKFCPEALSNVIRFVSKYWDKPILVTENGISTEDDKERVEFIIRAIAGIYQCLEEGINLIGYIHWSLLDNFEWQLGFSQKFGLIAVDRNTQKRYPKHSLYLLGDICKFAF